MWSLNKVYKSLEKFRKVYKPNSNDQFFFGDFDPPFLFICVQIWRKEGEGVLKLNLVEYG